MFALSVQVPLNFWDPAGLMRKRTPEQKETKLLAEINNGRLAMLGIFGLISASKGLIVPGMPPNIPAYSGNTMAAFSASDNLPFVADMLKIANF